MYYLTSVSFLGLHCVSSENEPESEEKEEDPYPLEDKVPIFCKRNNKACNVDLKTSMHQAQWIM